MSYIDFTIVTFFHCHAGNISRPRQIAAILQTTFSKSFSGMKIDVLFIQISPKFVRKGPIENKLAYIYI